VRQRRSTSLAAHQQKYAAAIRQARLAGTQQFHAWFNRESARTLEQCRVRGHWDWTLHILTPAVCAHLSRPEEKVALEIGYGGGRLINAACSYFKYVIGIDIHDERDAVAAFLQSQQKHNFLLLKTSGATIDLAAESVDFIYSFIVLQHVASFAALCSYVREVARCLKPGGVAQLYFGKFARLHPLYQMVYFLHGYKETHGAPANHISLVVRVAKMKQLCRANGLRVLAGGTSFFGVPDGYPARQGGQNYVTLTKTT
jgi:SAM-dependent methyltransferase